MNAEIVKRLFTALVRPHLEYAVTIWYPYNRYHIKEIEQIQRRATRLIPELRELPYEERLQCMHLLTLEKRTERGDLIQQFKIKKGIDKVCWYTSPNMAPSIQCEGPAGGLRGHKQRLQKEIVHNCQIRYNFFKNRVVNNWNRLTNDAVNSRDLNSFKNSIDSLIFN